MQKVYKCNSCGVSFMAEESPRVVCPHCQSDDTEPEKEGNSMKKIVIIAVCAFVLAIGVGMLIGFLKKNNADKGSSETIVADDEETVVMESREDDVEPAVEVVVTDTLLEGIDATPLEGLDSQSTDIAVEEPVQAGQAAPKDVEDPISKELQRKQEIEKDRKTAETKEQLSPAAKPQEPAKLPTAEKLTNGQVQALINKVLSTGSASALLGAKGVSNTVSFDYVDTGGETIPGGVTGLKSGVDMLGFSGYTVVSVGYDSQNKVNRITLRPIR